MRFLGVHHGSSESFETCKFALTEEEINKVLDASFSGLFVAEKGVKSRLKMAFKNVLDQQRKDQCRGCEHAYFAHTCGK